MWAEAFIIPSFFIPSLFVFEGDYPGTNVLSAIPNANQVPPQFFSLFAGLLTIFGFSLGRPLPRG